VDLKEPVLRPKGLGLGAERPKSNKDAVPTTGKNEEQTKLTMKIGAGALVNKGPYKSLYGQVNFINLFAKSHQKLNANNLHR
jgi:hypothetical protein